MTNKKKRLPALFSKLTKDLFSSYRNPSLAMKELKMDRHAEPDCDDVVAHAYGGTFVFGGLSDIVSVNPIYVQDVASGDAVQWIFAKLYDFSRNGNLVVQPWSLAAEPLKISDLGKTYTVKLKEYARWSDGRPVTADDVIFTFETLRNPLSGSPANMDFEKIVDMEKLDLHTVRIILREPYSPFQYALATELLPCHVLKDVHPEKLHRHPYGLDPRQTVTNGPWRWRGYQRNRYLLFEADPDYWGPRPHLSKVIYKIYTDVGAQVKALAKGEIDFIIGVPAEAIRPILFSYYNDDIEFYAAPGPQYEILGLNHNPDHFKERWIPWSTPKTRQAMVYALNRQAMIEKVLFGRGRILNSPFLPGTWYDPGDSAVSHPYDPKKAVALLREDGWETGKDGILVKNGHRFSFELQYHELQEIGAAMIQRYFRTVGIEVNLKAMDFSKWVEQHLNPGKFEAVLVGQVQTSLDPDQEIFLASKSVPPNGGNFLWYKNPDLDEILRRGNTEMNPKKRAEIYKEAASILSTDLPCIFLYQYDTFMAINKRIKFEAKDRPEARLANGYFYHAIRWWVDD
ncbi:ABC transporter substrate-binding protein [Paenibacillus sp. FSL W8-0194]|uniref:ABC transporter substrate-binding protein n=1 Tax=Paenibacillus sp. FSL W8-0194 TaxID=2921711 RepID=UPI0030DD06B1